MKSTNTVQTTPAAPMASLVRKAAMYVRMSSNPQDHSIQHQIGHLNQYALEQGFNIAMVYADAGKSGLRIDGRPGLQRLIADVQAGMADFQTVLVYDVSRWGRFQDIDESAYYEFLCRQAGVQVIYCAEHFTDDHSPMSALMKGVKRIMAAEYSRELGEKVHRAQCRFSQLGFKQGGRPGYGLCRVPVSQSGEAKSPLKPGERKPVATDRVVLAHSSAFEVAMVRRIYELYTVYGLTDSEIARQLQCEGHPTHMGHAWDNCTVRRILTNPRYCGDIVYNQTTRRLKGKMQANPQAAWIRCTGAVVPMVERTTYEQAQEIRRCRAAGPDRERVLRQLRAVFKRHGAINTKLCNASALPRRNTMLKMFGSYSNAYVAAGLPLPYTARGALGFHRIRAWVDSMLLQVIDMTQKGGATAKRTAVWNVLLLNDAITVKVSIASTRQFDDGSRRWRIPITCGAKADFVICALMEEQNEGIEVFLLLQTSTIGTASLFLSRNRLSRYDRQSFRTLGAIFGLEDNVI
jgi:DNA invertase Pin-like site-specific DNA recombinase